jgi:hypothetical protein
VYILLAGGTGPENAEYEAIAPANQAADPLKPTVGAVVITEAACGNTSFVLQLSVAPWPAGSEVYDHGMLYAKLYNRKDVL